MYSPYNTDPIMGIPAKGYDFADFFDNLKTDDLEYDLDKVSLPPPDVLDQTIDSDDDDFLRLNLPHISKPIHEGNDSMISNQSNQVFQDYRFPAILPNSNEGLLDAESDYSLNSQFFNSCSINPIEEPSLGYFDSYNSTESSASNINSVNPMTFESGASSHQYNRFNESPDSSSSYDSASVGSSSVSSGGVPKRPKKTLSDLTDEQKYSRIREQNNVASREYRNRRKTKKSFSETELKETFKRNEDLKLCTKKLEAQYQMCLRTKTILEKFGYNFSDLNLS